VPDNGSVGSHGCCDLYPGADTIQFSSRRARSVRSASLATLFILVSPRWVNTRCPAHDTWRGQPQSRRARIVHRVSGTVGGGHASSTVESNRGIAAGNGRPPAERNPQAPCNARSSKQSRQRKGWMQLSVPGLGSHCRPARDGPKWGVSCPSPQLRPRIHCPAIHPPSAPCWLQRPPTFRLLQTIHRAFEKSVGRDLEAIFRWQKACAYTPLQNQNQVNFSLHETELPSRFAAP
jgi:hypothetical protein